MRVKLQLVISNDQGQDEAVTDVIPLNKDTQAQMPLTESKKRLSTLQRRLLQQ